MAKAPARHLFGRKRKIYVGLSDVDAEKHGLLRIVDESGDDYLYPKAFFRRGQGASAYARPSSSLNSTSNVLSSSSSTTLPTWPRASRCAGKSLSRATTSRSEAPSPLVFIAAPNRLRIAVCSPRVAQSRRFLP